MNEPIAKRIRILMVKEYLTPTEFAKKAGLNPAQVSRLQKNADTISTKLLIRISKAFNVSIDWMLFGIGEMHLTKKEK